MQFDTVSIDEIVIHNRTRRDMGDLAGLAANIKEVGLLQPIVLNQQMELIAGGRRIEAFQILGLESIPAVIVEGMDELIDQLKGEWAENVFRKRMTPSEHVALKERIREIEGPKAAERQRAGLSADGIAGGRGRKRIASPSNPGGHSPQGLSGEAHRNPRVDDEIAKVGGRKRQTLKKAEAVVASGDAELIERMDKEGVEPAHRELVERQMPPPIKTDQLGVAIPKDRKDLIGAFDAADALTEISRQIKALRQKHTMALNELGIKQGSDETQAKQSIEAAWKTLLDQTLYAMPYAIVPKAAHGNETIKQQWRSRGWISLPQYQAVSAKQRKILWPEAAADSPPDTPRESAA